LENVDFKGTRPLISILVPVYNVADILHRCVDSILKQTYKELEVILINDGSTDESGALCDEYEKEDARVKVIHQENTGWCGARSNALDIVKGEWIGFVDSDDYIEPQMYEKLLASAVENGTLISACGFTEHLTDGKLKYYSYPDMPEVMDSSLFLKYRYRGITLGAYVSKLYHHSLFEGTDAVRFDPGCLRMGDRLFESQIMYRTDKFSYFPDTLYHYCRREGSITISPLSDKQMTTFYSLQRVVDVLEQSAPDIVHYAKYKISQIAILFLWNAYDSGGESLQYIPELHKEIRKYPLSYFLSDKIRLKKKLIYMLILISPGLAHRIRRMSKSNEA